MNTLNQKDIRTLINEGNFNEVVNRYKKIIQTEPNNYGAHNNLGNALKKLGKPEDIASLAVFLSSNKAKFITGSVIVVDGGQIRSV